MKGFGTVVGVLLSCALIVAGIALTNIGCSCDADYQGLGKRIAKAGKKIRARDGKQGPGYAVGTGIEVGGCAVEASVTTIGLFFKGFGVLLILLGTSLLYVLTRSNPPAQRSHD